MSEIKVERISLEELRLDQTNPRAHGERNRNMIADSIRRFGLLRGVVTNADREVLAGNGVTEEAMAEGFTEGVIVRGLTGNELLIMEETWLGEEGERSYAVADNRSGELAEWDPVNLKAVYDEDPEAIGGWFTTEELDKIFGGEGKQVEWHTVFVECDDGDQAEMLVHELRNRGFKASGG